nr:hypothetical protein [Terribacillus saccharophilus]
MTALSFYTVSIIALILLIVIGLIISTYLGFRAYNKRQQHAYMDEWQADRRQRE